MLDLEAIACHRSSVLGLIPGTPQPTQKAFDTKVWDALRGFSADRPVFVEAESKKIGNLRVPQTLIAAMWESRCVRLEATIELRVAMLMNEYRHFVADAASLGTQLDCLATHYGREEIASWKALADSGQWNTLVRELLEMHYDPAYTRSTLKHYPQLAHSEHLVIAANEDSAFEAVAAQCLATLSANSRAR